MKIFCRCVTKQRIRREIVVEICLTSDTTDPVATIVAEYIATDKDGVAYTIFTRNGFTLSVKSDDIVTCNEFDHLLCIERKGDYKVINTPDKAFIGRL